MTTFSFNAAFFAVCAIYLTVVAADHPNHDERCPASELTSGPAIADTLITSYISVDGDGMVLCGMEYMVPANATLYQGMLAANQQHGSNFKFNSTVFQMWGQFIDSINGVVPENGFFWSLFDKATLMTTLGVDFINLVVGSSYIWHFAKSTDHIQSYNGVCTGTSVIPPSMPLVYKLAYLSVSSDNTGQFTNDTFAPVCKKLVLIPPTATTAFTLLELASDQVPLSVQTELNMETYTVTSLNGLPHIRQFIWTGYRAGTNEPISYDLSMTAVSDGDHLEFRLIEKLTDMPSGDGAPSVGQTLTFLSIGVLFASVMMLS